METVKSLSRFFESISNDHRISSTHIGVFAALLGYSIDKGFANPIHAFATDIMAKAKISAAKTYRKCMKEMTEYGYIRYEPSFKKNKPSTIYFIE